MLFRLPSMRPDETLYSLAARIRLVNVARCDRDACRCMFGTTMNTHVDEFPVDIETFCRATNEQFGTRDTVTDRYTLISYFEKLGFSPWHRASNMLEPIQVRHGLGALSNGLRGRWRICPKCISRDRRCWGVAHWHRTHQLPATLFCPIDDVPLEERTLPYPDRHNRFFFPDEVPTRQPRMDKDISKNQELLIRLARLNVSIILDVLHPVPCRITRSAFMRALSERALVTASGKIHRAEFVREMQTHFGMLSPLHDFAHELTGESLGRLASELVEGSVSSVVHDLLLIELLFGSWSAYQSHCQWQAVMEEDSRLNSNDYIHRIEHSGSMVGHMQPRKDCLEILQKFPSISRSGFSRAAPKAFRWLMRNDAEWFDDVLPIRRPNHAQGLFRFK